MPAHALQIGPLAPAVPVPARGRRPAGALRAPLDDAGRRRLRLSNLAAGLSVLVAGGHALVFAALGWWPLALFLAVVSGLYALVPLLNRAGRHRLAALHLLVTAIVALTAAVVLFLGPESGVQLYLFIMTPFAVVMIDRRDRAWIAALGGLGLVAFLGAEYARFDSPLRLAVPPAVQTFNHVGSVVLTMGLIAIVTWTFSSDVHRAQTRLRAAKDEVDGAHAALRRDLDAAARVQASLLPARPPDSERARFAWRSRPCTQLAGDSLNVFRLDERHVGLYVLDVSGHGVPAALLAVAVTRALALRDDRTCLVRRPGPPGDPARIVAPSRVAEALNRLFPFDGAGQFFTLVYGVLDTGTGLFRFTSAGHPAPIQVRADGTVIGHRLEALPIGVVPEADFPEASFVLGPGDRVILYSDGLVEAPGPGGEAFGGERLAEALEGTRSQSLSSGLAAVIDRAERWCAPGGLRDDVSIVAAELI